MGKLFKILGITVGLLVLLLVAAVIILPLVIDPNDYKDEIVGKVQEHTGRTLTIEGDLNLSVFPWLGIDIGAMELSNAKGFEQKPFAAVRHAAVHVKLIPLLSSRLEVDSVGLEGLQLNLGRLEDGASNWDDLAGAGKAEPEQKAEEWGGDGMALAGLSIGGINIEDARVSWDDRSSGQYFEIAPFNLKSGEIVPGQPVALEMDLLFKSKAPQLDAAVELTATVNLDQAAGRLEVRDLRLSTDAKGEALPNGALQAELTAAVTTALDGESLTVSDLSLASGDLRLSGALNGRDLSGQPAFDGSLKLAEFNLKEWLSAQQMALPVMADEAAMTRVGAGFELNSQGGKTRLDNLSVVLDETRLSGALTLDGEAIGFNLNVDAIDLDRYLPPAAEQKETAEAAPASTGDEPLLPVEQLRSLNLDGVFKVGRLTINKLLAEQIELIVKAKNGRLQMSPAIGRFYQGGLRGQVDLDVTGKVPQLRIENRLNDLQAGPLLKDLTGEEKLTGRGDFNAKLSATGNSVNAIKQSLDGNLDFSFADGAVKGVNLAQLIRDTRAKFQGQVAATVESGPVQTDFSELSGSAVIEDGVLTNRDLLAKSPYLRVTGEGKVNLVPETLDYTLTPVIVSTAKGQGGEGLDDLAGVPIPVNMRGAYADPSFTIDWAKVLTATQKAKLQEKVEEKKQEVREKVQEKIQKQFGDQLKGLFN